MNSAHEFIGLSDESYCLPIPILVLQDERIVDFNLAASVLLAPAIDDIRDRSCLELLARLESPPASKLLPRWREGATLGHTTSPSSNSEIERPRVIQGNPCPIKTTRWKKVKIAPVSMLLNGTAPTAEVLYWQIVSVEEPADFHREYRERCEHELIWRSYARSYDTILPLLDYYKDCMQRHVGALVKIGAGTVLDVGGGTGNVAVKLAATGLRVKVIDASRAMLGRLRTKVADAHFENIEILQQSAENLGHLRSGSMDGVNILLSLYDMDDPARALDEALRVLRPGGTIVVTEPRRCFDLNVLKTHIEESLRRINRYDELHADWQRVFVANLRLDPTARRARLWAEHIWKVLKASDFRSIKWTLSHHDQCATITGRKFD